METRQYDALNRAITDTVTGPSSPTITTTTRYDHDGNVFQVQQPSGDTLVNTYDLADQLTGTLVFTAPISQKSQASIPAYDTYSYDSAGNQTQHVDADGRSSTTSYDGDNRAVQSVDSTSAPTGTTTITTTPSYDPNGNVVQQSTQTSDTTNPGVVQTHTYTASYNANNWPTSTSDDGLLTQYGYDAAAQLRTHTIMNQGTPVTTTLDAAGRATSITEAANGAGPYTTAYGYNANNEVITMTMPGSVQGTAQYDAASRLTHLSATGPSGVANPLSNAYDYGYNGADWTTSMTWTVNGGVTSTQLVHDSLGRLTQWSGQPNGPESWAYDPNGNIISNTEYIEGQVRTTVYTYSASVPNQESQQHSDNFGVEYFSYDQHGNTTSLTSTDPLTSSHYTNIHLTYDAQSRPITITTFSSGSPITVTFGYNASGQRSRYTVSMTGTILDEHFQYRAGELGQMAAYTATVNTQGQVTSSGAYTDTYLYDQAGLPLALLRQQSGTTSRYWYVLDGRTNVVVLSRLETAIFTPRPSASILMKGTWNDLPAPAYTPDAGTHSQMSSRGPETRRGLALFDRNGARARITVAFLEQQAQVLEQVLALVAQSPQLEAQPLIDAMTAVALQETRGPIVLLVGLDGDHQAALAAVQQVLAAAPTCGLIVFGRTPSLDVITRAMELGARRFLPYPFDAAALQTAVSDVHAEMAQRAGAAQPVTGGNPQGSLQAGASERGAEGARGSQVITVFSPKGGVGTSTLAVNLACALRTMGRRVALMDGNISFGTVGLLLSVPPRRTMLELAGDSTSIDESSVEEVLASHTSGLKALLAPIQPEEADTITSDHVRSMIRSLRSSYDYVVVDTWPSYDERVLAMLEMADGIIVPTGPDMPSIKNLAAFLRVARLLDYPSDKIVLVLMRADTVTAEHVAQVEAFLRCPLVWRMVSDGKRATQSANSGKPFVLTDPNAPISRTVYGLARMLDGQAETTHYANLPRRSAGDAPTLRVASG